MGSHRSSGFTRKHDWFPRIEAHIRGLRRTKSVIKLFLSDNRISGDVDILTHFSRALLVNQSIIEVDLLFNEIGVNGAIALQPALSKDNTRIKRFLVDCTLPDEIFQTLYRNESTKAKKGKKGKKGKKKKKK